ncbi:potassium efflux protein [Escherichia coli]|uniref:Potassium efflux protein n=1 Tax=Escherichia coli TaxID=562 RepID=A0A376TKJ9_ECOLX|nr:potassium efflux protein [Escherichia coli]
MDWDWIKAFPQSLKDEFKSMKITVNWEKPGLPFLSLSSLVLPLLLIAGADPLASGLAESVSTETGFRCGFPA